MKESYADLKTKLDEVIDNIQDPSTDLDQALILHAEGKKLIDKLEKYLGEVKEKIAKTKKLD